MNEPRHPMKIAAVLSTRMATRNQDVGIIVIVVFHAGNVPATVRYNQKKPFAGAQSERWRRTPAAKAGFSRLVMRRGIRIAGRAALIVTGRTFFRDGFS